MKALSDDLARRIWVSNNAVAAIPTEHEIVADWSDVTQVEAAMLARLSFLTGEVTRAVMTEGFDVDAALLDLATAALAGIDRHQKQAAA